MKKIYREAKIGIVDKGRVRHAIMVIGEEDDKFICRIPYNKYKKVKLLKSEVRISWPLPK